MNKSKIIACLAASVVVVVMLAAYAQEHALPCAFNGKDLTGWKVPEDNIWWRVEDGLLKLRSGPELKGTTLWTEKEYTNFVMEFEFLFDKGTVDSGIYIRTSKEQIQLGISGSLKRDMTGSPYISGKGYPVEAEGVKELLKPDDWNEMTIVVKGKHYSVWLNGVPVMQYASHTAVEKGPIGIQLHGNKMMWMEYRNIRIAELS